MFSQRDILKTQDMIDKRHLDIRTITMGISLLDCKKNTDAETAECVFEKVTRCAGRLVAVGEELEAELGVPIVNKRISVTPRAKQGLEQLTLHICGKRIDTTFLPATTQSMTLNGTRCFLPFCPQTLKHPTNNLVVYY